MIDAKNQPNLNGLVELANREGVDIRPTLLRVMTDLYIQKQIHTEQEEQHFTELALRLIDLVDVKTRSIVAAKIAGYATAPAAVRQRLLKDHISLTLTAAEPGVAPAKPSVAGKPAADELNELFFAADAEERRLILLNLPFALLPEAEPVARRLASRSTAWRLQRLAITPSCSPVNLSAALSISREQARRLIEDESGEPIVVAAVALGMPAAVLQRILLCLNPAISQSVQRVYDLAVLYEEIERRAALRLIAIWQAAHRADNKPAAARKPAHRAVNWQDGGKPALPADRPRIRWEEHVATRKAEGA